ncbi:carbohydrate ABC transporter permease [Paenibacillus spongiae]|uniref:Carbohydrate ABC transporter permease n=1 Tax=Paenibacillus spongiae TaxID=2909671 RepID=A0ABY5SFL9_9BACL|nr:carbohydrate ABC transporter permease [Paenibacillus spongiae]UVI32784.1 carbohydrate ABC transporter permease [Paenibacillus spongiae]
MKANGIRRTMEDNVIDIVIYAILIVVFVMTVYPFYYSLVISFNHGIDASRGGIYFWPRVFSLDNYKAVFSNHALLNGFGITISRTVIGTFATLLFTGLFAYSLSYNKLMFRTTYITLLIIAMYFSGGLIPYFILLKKLQLMNTFLVYIIPLMLNAFFTIIMMSFFRELPHELKESAKMDGASEMRIYFSIVIPISAPVFATIALFAGVEHWNSWFDAAFFVTDKDLKTISFMLMELINKANLTAVQGGGGDVERAATYAAQTFTAETIRMATMIVVIIPIICVYPFLQRYFVKGIMVGSIKG